MIDKEIFAQGMGQLGGAFGREIDGPVSKMYYGILSQRLTTEQFTAGIVTTIASERFWPSPAVILSHALGDPDVIAIRALTVVRDTLSKHGGVRYTPFEAVQFDAPTWAAIKEVGGLEACTLERSERRFVKAYLAAINPAPAITHVTPERIQPAARQMISAVAQSIGRDHAIPKGDR